MSDWEPGQGWDAWMAELDMLLWAPRPVYSRPSGLAELGVDSYFIEPYKIRSPHRIHVGDNVIVGERAFLSVVQSEGGLEFDPCLRIGDDVRFNSDVFIHCVGTVEIGTGAGLGARVFIGDSGRDFESLRQPGQAPVITEPRPVRIHDHAVVGTGAILLEGVTVGERAFVGAGAVVTRDVPPRSIVFGNPARVVRRWDESAGEWRTGG